MYQINTCTGTVTQGYCTVGQKLLDGTGIGEYINVDDIEAAMGLIQRDEHQCCVNYDPYQIE